MKIGPAIKVIRKQIGLTQAQLSEATDISQTSLSKIESGDSTPSKKNLAKIAAALDVPTSVIYILGMEDSDVSSKRKKMYGLLFPTIKKLALDIVGEEGKIAKG